MSEIHKFVCDECGKEKDLLTTYYGSNDIWHKLHTKNYLSFQPLIKHACSTECVIKILQKEKERDGIPRV